MCRGLFRELFTRCTTIQDQVCNTRFEQQCAPVMEKICTSETEAQCEVVTEKFETVQDDVSNNIPNKQFSVQEAMLQGSPAGMPSKFYSLFHQICLLYFDYFRMSATSATTASALTTTTGMA